METTRLSEEFDMLVPVALVPCQYQVVPDGGELCDSVLSPQVFEETEGVAGEPGNWLMVTVLLPDPRLQQPASDLARI